MIQYTEEADELAGAHVEGKLALENCSGGKNGGKETTRKTKKDDVGLVDGQRKGTRI